MSDTIGEPTRLEAELTRRHVEYAAARQVRSDAGRAARDASLQAQHLQAQLRDPAVDVAELSVKLTELRETVAVKSQLARDLSVAEEACVQRVAEAQSSVQHMERSIETLRDWLARKYPQALAQQERQVAEAEHHVEIARGQLIGLDQERGRVQAKLLELEGADEEQSDAAA